LIFFISIGRGWQIRRIDNRQGLAFRQTTIEQAEQQMRVDAPQSRHPNDLAKLMQHFCIGNLLAMGQVGKASPGAVFLQQFNQQIEGMSRG
jgi:hypothetical protein